jgi:tetratricopeptide (TPR) repeat protein/DNA-binding NarL/FixJ family response regulator
LVGADSVFEPALRAALLRHRVYLETTTPDTVAENVIAAAPDLVLLMGDAAKDGGTEILKTLMSSPVCSVVPVAILDDNAALDDRLRAFRHGAAAVIPRSASIDAIAERVEKLAKEIPDRVGESLGTIGEATLSEFVGTLSKELRSGILSVHAGKDQEAVRLVLGGGRPLAAFIDDFVKRVKSHVVHAEPLRYEFAEHAGGTVALLDPDTPSPEPARPSIAGIRVALADDDTGRADSVAQELRSRGATIVVTDLAPTDLRFARLRQVDPEVLLIGEEQVKTQGYELLKRMRRDTRLRWASLLVVRWEEIWSEALSVPALDRLETALHTLAEADRTLQDWAASGEIFDARLEATGPARCLRALVTAPRAQRVQVTNPRISVTIDVSDNLVVGAAAEVPGDASQRWEGALALSAFMVLSSGRVRVEPVTQPAATNVMATIDVALNMADSEPSPITPSVPSAAAPSLRPAAATEGTVPQPDPTNLPSEASDPTPQLAPLDAPRARAGVSWPAATFLVALAALQGLLLVLAYSALSHKPKSSDAAPVPIAATTPAPALAAAPTLAAPPASTPTVAPTAPAPAIASASAVPAHASTPPILDETGLHAPSCESLFGTTRVDQGEYPGSAYVEMKNANRSLVQGDIDGAQRSLCKAARWDQKNPAIPLELSHLLLLRRDGAGAVDWATKSLALDPNSVRAEEALADGLARVGDFEGAKKAWFASSHLDGSTPDQAKNLAFSSVHEADASMRRLDFARAERYYRRAVVLDPDSVVGSNGLANALLKLGDTASALRWANHAVSVAPRDPTARVILGDILFQQKDKQAAEVEWHEALQLDPANAVAARRLKRLQSAN